MKISIFIIVIMMFFLDIQAQPQSVISIGDMEVVTYIQIVGEDIRYVSRYTNHVVTYTHPRSVCSNMSPDGRYLLLSSRQQPTQLDIMYFPSQKIIFSIPWSANWFPCLVIWAGNNAIRAIQQDVDIYFQFENLTLTSITDPNIQNYPQLPNFLSTTLDNFILQSPSNPNIYAYQKCLSGNMLDELSCEGLSDVVIYDTSTNQEIAILEGASIEYLLGYYIDRSESGNMGINSRPLISWSPDGRYLSYFEFLTIPDDGKVLIYDLQLDRYLNDTTTPEPRALYYPNIWRNLEWSDENVLVIWKTGGTNDEFPYDPHGLINYFAFVHADTQTYITSAVFQSWSANSRQDVIFAPDSRAIAIVGYPRFPLDEEPDLGSLNRGNLVGVYRGKLILVDTNIGGRSTIIDENVTEIITWRSICDFTVSDTASLISTMQTEPYSVICLDENGQYDLTTPLPDVAGDITIIGNGSTLTMTGQNRILNVVYNQQWSRNGSLSLKNVTLSGGVADDGGAIYNAGDLTLENVTLQNHSAVRGGAIYNAGVLNMNGGAIQNNTASEFGGGIYTIGDMQLDGVNIRDNTAPEGSGVYQGE